MRVLLSSFIALVVGIGLSGCGAGLVVHESKRVELNQMLGRAFEEGALIVGSSFFNQSFNESSGRFSVRFTVVPQLAPLDAVIGISNGAADGFSDLAAIVRLNPQGVFDVRDGGGYRADVNLRYSSWIRYSIRMELDIAAKRYSVFVRPENGVETRIASSYGFRSEQALVQKLNTLASVVISPGRIDLTGLQKTEVGVNTGVSPGVQLAAPSGSVLISNFNIVEAGRLLSQGSAWIPNPWLADPCGPNSLLASVDGLRFRQIIRDGCRWSPSYSPGTVFNYARAEVALASTPKIPANIKSWIEWRGYFPQDLPPAASSGSTTLVVPFQMHNDNSISPMYALAINLQTKKIQLDIHDMAGKWRSKVDLADYSTFVNRVRTIRMGYIPSSSANGLVEIEIDGVLVYQARNIQSSNTPGRDYVKFGLYDWGRALVSPDLASRGRTFEMVTESFRLYRAQ